MKIFISYSHKDQEALDRLRTHLKGLSRQGLITAWFDREILAGGEINDEIEAKLETSDIFLLLISPDFIASDYCMDTELEHAVKRHNSGDARVIPIIIEPCNWLAEHNLKKLKALPKDGQPISEWGNQNSAYLEIVQELTRIIENSLSGTKENIDEIKSIPAPTLPKRNIRVKRTFDQIEQNDFRDHAFVSIRNYFQKHIEDLKSHEGINSRFHSQNKTVFSCSIINSGYGNSDCHVTFHSGNSNFSLGDIYYSYAVDAPENTANGTFNIESDEYELYLKTGISNHFSNKKNKYSPEQAAELVFNEMLHQVGIEYG